MGPEALSFGCLDPWGHGFGTYSGFYNSFGSGGSRVDPKACDKVSPSGHLEASGKGFTGLGYRISDLGLGLGSRIQGW